MLGRMEHAIENYRTRGIRWRAKTLTDRGPGSQESQFGADFAGVVEMNLPEYKVSKGFLAQAKLLEPGDWLSHSDLRRLREQCDRMLSRTADAFVFVYSRQDISIIPALAVLSSEYGDLHAHYRRSVRRFYEEHFSCFIGDRAISEPSAHMLDTLPERIPARVALAIRAESDRIGEQAE